MNPSDYRRQLTDRIIEQLENGTAPWIKPWSPQLLPPSVPHNALTSRRYHGANSLWLQCQGHSDPRWCTYRQAQEAGWQVRRGEKSSVVEYWQWTREEKDATGQTVEVKLDAPRVFYAHVFNATQMDHAPELVASKPTWEPEVEAEKILQNSGVTILQDQTDRAFYSPTRDEIHIPPRVAFINGQRFYGTALHELGHWSGHPDRLNRDLSGLFGTPAYAQEELRAELGSFFLAARLGITHDIGQHAAYVKGWIDVLRKDHNEIFRASHDAEKICDFVLEFQHQKANVTTVALSPSPAVPQPAKAKVHEDELEC